MQSTHRTWDVCISTFFSLPEADPERMASSIASLAKTGFLEVLALVLGLPWGKTGGGGGGANMGAGGGGGGGGVKTGGEVQVKDGGEGDGEGVGPAPLSSTEATFLNLSSSPAASDLVCRTQKSETMETLDR